MALLVFLVLEVCMIVLEPLLSRGMYQYHAELGFQVRPYAQNSNRFGFNDRDYALSKPPNAYRILVLGDSFNWAGGRQHNYVSLLRRHFSARYGDQLQVINAGYPMTHTAEQLGVLRLFGLQYQPDAVLLGFFMGNDFVDADPNRKRIVVYDTVFDIDRRRELRLFGYPIVAQSRLYQFLRQRIGTLAATLPRMLARDAEAATDEEFRGFTQEVFDRIKSNQLQFFDRQRHHEDYYDCQINYIRDSLEQMAVLLNERGIAFAVAVFPDQLQVDDALLQRIASVAGKSPADFDLQVGNRLLRDALLDLDIAFVDLTPSFRQHSSPASLYVPNDTHWSRDGNRLAAERLFAFLTPLTPPPAYQ